MAALFKKITANISLEFASLLVPALIPFFF